MSYFFGRLETNMWCERMRRGFLIIWFYVIYSLICRLKSDEERSKGSSSSTAGDREKDRDGRDRERERSRDGDDRWVCATVLRYSLPMPCLKSPLSILRSFYCQFFRLLSIEWMKYIYNLMQKLPIFATYIIVAESTSYDIVVSHQFNYVLLVLFSCTYRGDRNRGDRDRERNRDRDRDSNRDRGSNRYLIFIMLYIQ